MIPMLNDEFHFVRAGLRLKIGLCWLRLPTT